MRNEITKNRQKHKMKVPNGKNPTNNRPVSVVKRLNSVLNLPNNLQLELPIIRFAGILRATTIRKIHRVKQLHE